MRNSMKLIKHIKKAHATNLENFQQAVAQLKSSLEQGENILKRNINAEILKKFLKKIETSPGAYYIGLPWCRVKVWQ